MNETASWIARLTDRNAAARKSAAAALYQHGCSLAEAAIRHWRSLPELAALLTGRLTVGVAVEPGHFEKIRAANGSPRLADVPPDQDAKEFELDFDGEVRLDILTTNAPGGAGAIARFLERHNEGIQQVECLTADVDRATALLRSRFALEPTYPHARPGADCTRVNFFLVPAASGKKVLLELVEAAPAGSAELE